VAVISVDAGKAQFREEDKGPASTRHTGRYEVACLQTYENVANTTKTRGPSRPRRFWIHARGATVSRDAESTRPGNRQQPTKEPAEIPAPKRRKKEEAKSSSQRPRRLVGTCGDNRGGRPIWLMVMPRHASQDVCSEERALIADGGNWIGPLGQLHFPDWIQILDFLHRWCTCCSGSTGARADAGGAWKFTNKCCEMPGVDACSS